MLYVAMLDYLPSTILSMELSDVLISSVRETKLQSTFSYMTIFKGFVKHVFVVDLALKGEVF